MVGGRASSHIPALSLSGHAFDQQAHLPELTSIDPPSDRGLGGGSRGTDKSFLSCFARHLPPVDPPTPLREVPEYRVRDDVRIDTKERELSVRWTSPSGTHPEPIGCSQPPHGPLRLEAAGLPSCLYLRATAIVLLRTGEAFPHREDTLGMTAKWARRWSPKALCP